MRGEDGRGVDGEEGLGVLVGESSCLAVLDALALELIELLPALFLVKWTVFSAEADSI